MQVPPLRITSVGMTNFKQAPTHRIGFAADDGAPASVSLTWRPNPIH
jgi:hypothetical protein